MAGILIVMLVFSVLWSVNVTELLENTAQRKKLQEERLAPEQVEDINTRLESDTSLGSSSF